MGYFLLAAPVPKLKKLVGKVDCLKQCETIDEIKTVEFAQIATRCGIAHAKDYDGLAPFRIALLFSSDAVTETAAAGAHGGTDRYGFQIYGVAADEAALKSKSDQRLTIEIRQAQAPSVPFPEDD
jgi:hypothetical protein